MIALEILWYHHNEAVERLFTEFELPAPKHFGDLEEDEAMQIVYKARGWDQLRWEQFVKALQGIELSIGTRLAEWIFDRCTHIEDSEMNNEIQEHTDGDLPITS